MTGGTAARRLWIHVGGLMLRLLTDLPGFSLPDPPLAELTPRLADLRRRLDIATFGAIARRDEISDILRKNLARLQAE